MKQPVPCSSLTAHSRNSSGGNSASGAGEPGGGFHMGSLDKQVIKRPFTSHYDKLKPRKTPEP